MDQTILQIINDEAITSLYQPIVNLITGEIMGYEALSRGPEWSHLYSPVELIKEAKLHGLSHELDFLFRKKAIENIKGLEQSQRLFLNISPDIMKEEHNQKGATKNYLKEKGMSPKKIVLELTERSMISDYEAFNKVLKHYRDQEYKIAIDDVGAGYSGLRTIRETEPNFIKIDMELIRNIDTDSFKEALINAFLNFSITTNIQLIAEGIESESELTKLIEMGVHYGQGYFLQRPAKELKKLREDVLKVIHNNNDLQKDMHLFKDGKDMIGAIVNNCCYTTSSATCEDIKATFDKTNCEGICIIENTRPVGILMRENLLSMLSSRYGLSLYLKKKVTQVMDIDYLMVDYHTSISEVSTKAMSRDSEKTYDIIVVTKNGEFHGIVSINTLLRHLITVKTQIAKELNPLTRLPGNLIIHRVLNDLILYKPKCAIVYLDFDFFKPYNDIYGFESGDQFIKKVSELILKEIKTSFPYNSFVGHIGGDDFIFVIEGSKEDSIAVCENIVTEFENIKNDFYTESDFEKGYIHSLNRNNEQERFNLVTLSISGIYNNLERFESVEHLSKHMSLIKKEAKAVDGNIVLIR